MDGVTHGWAFSWQRPTLPGDIAPLFRPQGAGADILTKYVLRSVKDDLGEKRCR